MPKRILALYLLIGLQAVVYCFAVALAIVSVTIRFEQGIREDLQTSLCDYAGVDNIQDFGIEQVGAVIGKTIIPLTLLVLAWLSIRRRHRLPLATLLLLLLLTHTVPVELRYLLLLGFPLLILPGSRRIWSEEQPVAIGEVQESAAG